MAQVDFTLEDFDQLLNKRITEERKHTKELFEAERSHMDARFNEAELATAKVITTVIEHMDERFAQVDERFARVDERFEKIEADLNGVKRDLVVVKRDLAEVKVEVKGHSQLLARHSQDIMDLRASH